MTGPPVVLLDYLTSLAVALLVGFWSEGMGFTGRLPVHLRRTSDLKMRKLYLYRLLNRVCSIIRKRSSYDPWLIVENRIYMRNLHEHFCKGRVIVFDTETTGLDYVEDDIIQLAAVEVLRGESLSEMNVFFSTTRPLSPTQTKHNISNDHLAAKSIDKTFGLQEFQKFIRDDPLIAHNISFDYQMINSNLERIGLERVYINKCFCTLKASRIVYPKFQSYKLASLIDSLHLSGRNSHDALDDSKATVELLKKLMNGVDKKLTGGSI